MAVLIIHENDNEIRIHAFKHEGRKLMRHIPKHQWFHYVIGEAKPNYPMPSIYCFSRIARDVDIRACEINTLDMLWSYLK